MTLICTYIRIYKELRCRHPFFVPNILHLFLISFPQISSFVHISTLHTLAISLRENLFHLQPKYKSCWSKGNDLITSSWFTEGTMLPDVQQWEKICWAETFRECSSPAKTDVQEIMQFLLFLGLIREGTAIASCCETEARR